MSLPVPFPRIEGVAADYNPAIRLFGKRFISEQTIVEYLAEFLAVAFSDKWIGKNGEAVKTPLLSLEQLEKWSNSTGTKLYYKPPVKLNLKLIAFLSCSRVDTRHDVHKRQYEDLVKKLASKIKTNNYDEQEAINWIEALLRGLQGAGFNRTWCAQTFYPVSASLLTQETIWNETVVKREPVNEWMDSVRRFHKYYSVSKHRFLARGGELLYLQLCNVFATEPAQIRDFAQSMGFSTDEADLQKLHQSLQEGLQKLRGQYTSSFDQLVDYIEMLDSETHHMVNNQAEKLACEWCPRGSWPEAYLFAVEIKRLLTAVLDPVERLELLMTGCALQVLRSLCAQSVRYAGGAFAPPRGSALGYAWIFSPPVLSSRQQRLASQRNLQVVQGLIQKALRHPDLEKNAAGAEPNKTKEKLYKEADKKYGHKLFLSLGKKLGIIVPPRGRGARFIMTDSLQRYMVLVLLEPGQSCTYEDFLKRLFLHYGIAIEGEELKEAVAWSELPQSSSVQTLKGPWLAEMLRAGGFLTELSDACSIVNNTFGQNK